VPDAVVDVVIRSVTICRECGKRETHFAGPSQSRRGQEALALQLRSDADCIRALKLELGRAEERRRQSVGQAIEGGGDAASIATFADLTRRRVQQLARKYREEQAELERAASEIGALVRAVGVDRFTEALATRPDERTEPLIAELTERLDEGMTPWVAVETTAEKMKLPDPLRASLLRIVEEQIA